MPRNEIDLDPVDRITVDAIGRPGQRVFYIQGSKEAEVVTLLVEKTQVQTLAIGIDQFLAEINQKYPDLTPASFEFEEEKMRIYPPVDPVFRAGELGLAYDSERDLVVLVVREVLTEGKEPEEVGLVRFWATRSQIAAMSAWGREVSSRGRPLCPQCGEPMEPEGHFCPKKNGHKH